jgi:hypothetical protein
METTFTMAELVARDINRTNGKFFTIVFTKKDGTIRKMTCRTGVKKGVTGKGLAFEPKEKGLRVVWSTDAEGYRMINIASVTEINFKGIRTYYTTNHN